MLGVVDGIQAVNTQEGSWKQKTHRPYTISLHGAHLSRGPSKKTVILLPNQEENGINRSDVESTSTVDLNIVRISIQFEARLSLLFFSLSPKSRFKTKSYTAGTEII